MKSTIAKTYIVFISLLLSVLSLWGEETKNWPREITSDEGKITIFQPEIESFADDKMECRSAVAVEMEEKKAPVFGAIWYECRIATDRDNRTVTLQNLDIEADKFPNIENDEVEKINSYIEKEVPKWEMVMSLDDIVTGLEFNDLIKSYSEKLDNKAPEIIFATAPAALILIDGEPEWGQIENTNFDYVVNTPFFVAKDRTTGLCYLKGGDDWYASGNIYNGWKVTDNVPRKLKNIANESDNSEIPQNGTTLPSQIIVRTTPAELLLSNGAPQYSTVESTSLLYMTNTDDDIILDIDTQEFYVLISGRWFKSKKLDSNDWTFIQPDSLPEDFAKIPENSPMSNVRVSVSGTREAKEAVLETKIPQTAEVDRNAATLEVTYDGDPVFEEIEGTDMMYAVNTDKDVLLINNTYYCCDNAVWFESDNPLGPWIVAVEIPHEIMDIPPEYPVYPVKFVFIFDYTSEVVHVGYLQGYVNNFIYRGCVFYGTGYHYKPWYKSYYYPRPLTYGFSAHYNPFSGWGFSYGVSFGGFRWISYDSRFHSNFDGYWGPSGYRHGYYRRTTLGKKRGFSDEKPEPPKGKKLKKLPDNAPARNIATNNVYMRRNNGVARTGSYRIDPKTGKQITSSSSAKRQAKPSGHSNNLYSDQSGNVYKRKNNGTWESKTNSSSTKSKEKTSNKQNNKRTANQATSQNQNTTAQKTNNQSRSTNTRRSTNSNTSSQRKNTSNRQTQTKNNLNRQYKSRTRSSERTENFNKNKTQNKYVQPTKTDTQSRAIKVNKASGGQNRSSSKGTSTNKKSTTTPKRR